MLTGYITSLVAYCAITGESAVGQPSGFCNDSTLNPAFDFEAYVTDSYNYADPSDTNFIDVFNSPDDILGIQKIVDYYLANKIHRNY